MSKEKAYLGLWIFSRDILALLEKIAGEAETKRRNIRIIGGSESAKLEGCILTARAIKESIYSMEQYGALIPGKEVKGEEPVEATESTVPGPEAA